MRYLRHTALLAGVLLLFVASRSIQPPRPLAIVLALDERRTLHDYAGIARYLPEWEIQSIDLPAHGDDRRSGEPPELLGWRARFGAAEPVIGDFIARMTATFNLRTRPSVALVGVSRGAFLALHAMAHLPDVDAVIGFKPVTELGALTEFKTLPASQWDVRMLPLKGRPIWLSITENDARVNTSAAKRAAADLGATLQITAGDGHIHSDRDEQDAAAWLRATIHNSE